MPPAAKGGDPLLKPHLLHRVVAYLQRTSRGPCSRGCTFFNALTYPEQEIAMRIFSPEKRSPELLTSLLALWESSVRATHHFLTEQDVQALIPLVASGLEEIPSLLVIADTEGTPLGFMGLDGTKIEMLFISPSARGSGLGRQLIRQAVDGFRADSVDVNEQNTQALDFYLHVGFAITGRSALDSQGNPFPLLHMTLRSSA